MGKEFGGDAQPILRSGLGLSKKNGRCPWIRERLRLLAPAGRACRGVGDSSQLVAADEIEAEAGEGVAQRLSSSTFSNRSLNGSPSETAKSCSHDLM